MSLTIDSTVKLRAGGLLPRLGLGVYQSRGNECFEAVKTAIAAGYRHVDSAQAYRNEDLVGKAVAESGTPRTSLFITTKYMPSRSAHSQSEVYSALRNSIKPLNKDASSSDKQYIDLMLIHAPFGGAKGRAANWAALAQAQKEGWIKDIGVSNFGVKHLEELPDPVPAINQIEIHPWCQQREIAAYCEKHGIVLEAYCPLVRADKKRMEDPVLVKVCKKHGVEPAQVLIRWGLQKGFVSLPKSVTPSRIKSNADVYGFELDKEDMASLDALDLGAKGACSWNPVDAD